MQANIRSIYDRLPTGGRSLITIPGANQYMFSDDTALLKVLLVMRVLQTLGVVRIDGRRQLALAAHHIGTFFDVHLKGAPVSKLESSGP